jgi:hypothetical protein
MPAEVSILQALEGLVLGKREDSIKSVHYHLTEEKYNHHP